MSEPKLSLSYLKCTKVTVSIILNVQYPLVCITMQKVSSLSVDKLTTCVYLVQGNARNTHFTFVLFISSENLSWCVNTTHCYCHQRPTQSPVSAILVLFLSTKTKLLSNHISQKYYIQTELSIHCFIRRYVSL